MNGSLPEMSPEERGRILRDEQEMAEARRLFHEHQAEKKQTKRKEARRKAASRGFLVLLGAVVVCAIVISVAGFGLKQLDLTAVKNRLGGGDNNGIRVICQGIKRLEASGDHITVGAQPGEWGNVIVWEIINPPRVCIRVNKIIGQEKLHVSEKTPCLVLLWKENEAGPFDGYK